MSTERTDSPPTGSASQAHAFERQEEEFVVLAEITHALATSSDPASLRSFILERVSLLLRSELSALAQLEAAGPGTTGSTLLAVEYLDRRTSKTPQTFTRPDPLIEAVSAEARPLRFEAAHWIEQSALVQHLLADRPLQNGVCLPIVGATGATEAVLITLNRPEPFAEADLRLLENFANLLSIVERLHPPSTPEPAPTRAYNAEHLLSPIRGILLDALCAGVSDDTLIERLLATLRPIVGADRIEFVFESNPTAEARGGERTGQPGRRYINLSGHAATRRPNDIGSQSPRTRSTEPLLPAGVREVAQPSRAEAVEGESMVYIPVAADGRVYGTLLAAWRASGTRTWPIAEDVIDALRTIGIDLARTLTWSSIVRRAVTEADALERRLAEHTEALEQTRKQLVQSQWLASLGELAAGVAHDLNNALNPIVAFAELIREHGTEPERVRTYAERILMAAQGGAETVRRIQRFTRRRLRALPLETVSLAKLVEEAVELTRPSWRERTGGGLVQIETLIDDDLTVECNLGELRQALLNLITNALDAMPGGGTLRFVGRVVDNEVLLAVQDTGGGMPDEVLEHALEPFYTTKGVRGTGLGLSEVFGIARRHGGRLEIETWPEHGTTVLLRLPNARPEPRAKHPGFVDSAPRRPHRLLLVDDNVLSLEATAASLRSAGHTVTTATRAEEALGIFDSGQYDLVFSDLGLPDMSGWDLLEQLRTLDPDLRLGVITGWSLPESNEELTRRGIELVFIKPVDPDELLASL